MNQKGYLNKVSKKMILTIALTILSILVIYGLYVFYPIYKKIQFYNEYGWLIGEWNYEHYNMEDKSISSYTMGIVYNKVYFGDIPRNFHIENNSLIIEVGESGRDLILPIDIEEKRIYVEKIILITIRKIINIIGYWANGAAIIIFLIGVEVHLILR